MKRLLALLLSCVMLVSVFPCVALADNITVNESVCRVYGSNRYETSRNIADKLMENIDVDKFNSVIIASGTNFPDALAGSYLASVTGAPIILTNNNRSIDMNWVEANVSNNANVYVLGGAAAVSKKIETQLKKYNVERLAGTTRYETNLIVLKRAIALGGNTKDILVCAGSNFADSLSASATGKAILLVGKSLKKEQKTFLSSAACENIYILGGYGAVDTKIENELATYGSVKRIGGNDRYETSVKIAETFFPNATSAVIAYAKNFPDGLCGGPLAFNMGAPLILTRTGNEAMAVDYASHVGIKSGIVLGGPGLISDDTAKKIFNTNKADTQKPTVEASQNHKGENKGDEVENGYSALSVMKKGKSYYNGSLGRSKITSITFTNTAPAKYDEKWSANEADTYDITGYRVGTDVYIVGDKIFLNPSCYEMFCVKDLNGKDVWSSLREVNGLDIVDTSLVKDMGYMFCGGSYFANLDVGNWDVSNVWRMTAMFAGCTNLEHIDVSRWNVGKVQYFTAMFQGSDHIGDMKLKEIDVGNWNTQSADSMGYMFYGCAQLENIDVDNWNVKGVLDFDHMFTDCFSLKTINISNWDTLSVGTFNALFNDCRSLTTIDVSGLDTSTCVQFSQMFESCINLEKIIGLENWDTSNAHYSAFSETFHNCPKLTSLDLSTWNTAKADNMARMFAGCTSLRYLDLSSFDISNVETMYEMFKGCSSELIVVGMDGWNLEGVDTTNMV